MLTSPLVYLCSFALLPLTVFGANATADHSHGKNTSLNILLSNDDSWAAANIRATYDALKADGHNVLLVAPAVQQSGHGGTFVGPTTNITAPGGEFGSIPVGAPFFGHDELDQNIWYFNGTPAACVVFALDIIIPTYFNNETIDLVVGGPNEGQNTGPFFYTLSGTMGVTYAAIERNIPAVAFSAGNGTHRSFTTNTGLPDDPANIAAQLTTNFVAALASGVDTNKSRLLPLGVGIGVNLPTFGPDSNCTEPPFTLTRMTGGAKINTMTLDPVTGFPNFVADLAAPGLNVKFNGLDNLPGETPVSAECQSAVSVFSIDYDAPTEVAAPIQAHLSPIFGKSKL